jgi:hypothetical protein
MLEEQIPQLIGSLGFPIVVTLWFMLRTEKVISANTAVMEQIKLVMVECKK